MRRITPHFALLPTLLHLVPASTMSQEVPKRPVATYSIVARDAATGELGGDGPVTLVLGGAHRSLG